MGNDTSNLKKRFSDPRLAGSYPPSSSSSPNSHTRTRNSNDKTGTSSTYSNSNVQPNFKWLDGMKYHDREGVAYILPVDGVEIDRLYIQHCLLKIARNGVNFLAPVMDKLNCNATVMDVACGPGSWVLEMGTDFPNSNFVGIDIADNFPTDVHPTNVKFHITDINHGLPFSDLKFDFIHQRFVSMALTQEQWLPLLRELYRCIVPGGYLELNECDLEGKSMSPASKRLISATLLCLQARGINAVILRELSAMLREVGFTDIKHSYVSVPAGWGGEIGEMCEDNLKIALRGLRPMLMPMLGLKTDQYATEATDALLGNRAAQAYWNYHTWTCMKPEE